MLDVDKLFNTTLSSLQRRPRRTRSAFASFETFYVFNLEFIPKSTQLLIHAHSNEAHAGRCTLEDWQHLDIEENDEEE